MRWVQASVGANIRMIPTSDILFFRAEDKYTRVQTQRFEALIRKPIKELIDELDPDEFWQIHRATVVRVDAVEQVSRNLRGNQVVHVKGSDEKLEVSRTLQSPVQADVERRVRSRPRCRPSRGASGSRRAAESSIPPAGCPA